MPQRRKSVAEHRLLGNYRPDRHRDPDPPATIPQGRPPYPQHLSPAAKREYKRICSLLEQRGHLTPADYFVIAALATVLARWITAKAELDAAGSLLLTVTWLDKAGDAHSTVKPNPLLRICENCESQILRYSKALGLSPMDRSKVERAGAAPAPKTLTEEERVELEYQEWERKYGGANDSSRTN